MKRRSTKAKTVREIDNDEIPPQYDFTNSRPNPYAVRFRDGTNIVVLDPDVVEDFPDSKSVNDALRALSAIIKRRSKSRRSA